MYTVNAAQGDDSTANADLLVVVAKDRGGVL